MSCQWIRSCSTSTRLHNLQQKASQYLPSAVAANNKERRVIAHTISGYHGAPVLCPVA